MARYDFQKLRSDHNITQKELADKLKLSQGFLSSVEKWRNPFPDDRVQDLQAVFPNTDLTQYEVDEDTLPDRSIGSHNKFSQIDINNPEVLKKLLDIVEKCTSESDGARNAETSEAAEWRKRYDKVCAELDAVRGERDRYMKEKYELQFEIFRLKELLLRNGIEYEEKK